MKDRVAGAPGQYSATVTGAEFNKLQNGEPFAITLKRDDKPEVEGTPYSKAAVLPDHVARKLCPSLGNPSPADAFDALASEVGNKEDVYNLLRLPEVDEEGFGCYITATGDPVYKEGCYAPWTYHYNAGDKPVTMKIKTYMYGDMAVKWSCNGEDYFITNANANVADNPESGIFEQEFIIPSHQEGSCEVSFCENPYLECPVFCKVKKSLWEEVGPLTENSPIEWHVSLDGQATDDNLSYSYRRYCNNWSSAIEMDFYAPFNVSYDGSGNTACYIDLPFNAHNHIDNGLSYGGYMIVAITDIPELKVSATLHNTYDRINFTIKGGSPNETQDVKISAHAVFLNQAT